MRDREEHLAECKKRALEYLDTGDIDQAFTSMLSDVGKHPETENHVGIRMGVGLMMVHGWITNSVEVRRWIDGFR